MVKGPRDAQQPHYKLDKGLVAITSWMVNHHTEETNWNSENEATVE